MTTLPPPGEAFVRKKAKILSQLAVPDSEYTDASPKGSVDAGIRQLIEELNGRSGLVTTSSCAGRVSVYLEGKKGAQQTTTSGAFENAGEGEVRASSSGGKGGGEWLFVSHDPVERPAAGDGAYAALLGMGASTEIGTGSGMSGSLEAARLIHFKFEPMVSSSPSGFW